MTKGAAPSQVLLKIFAVGQQSLESDAEKADQAEAETSLAAVVIAHSRLRPSIRLELLRFRRCSFIGRGTVHVPVGVQRQVLVIPRVRNAVEVPQDQHMNRIVRCHNRVAKPRTNQPYNTDDCGGAQSPS